MTHPGLGFRLQMVLFLTTGAMFVMWLGEQITERGVGNGASLLIFFSIVERIWPGIGQTFAYVQTGTHGAAQARAARHRHGAGGGGHGRDHGRGPARADPDPAAHDGARAPAREREELHPAAHERGERHADHLRADGDRRAGHARAVQQESGLQEIAEYFQPGTGWYYLLSALLILFFTYFYTSIIFNPIDIAENLKKQGGFIPGVKPGARTAEYIDRVVTRITLPGAIFLTLIALLPIVISDIDQRAVPIWRNVAADRRWRGTGHGPGSATAAADPEVRRIHEEGCSREVPRARLIPASTSPCCCSTLTPRGLAP